MKKPIVFVTRRLPDPARMILADAASVREWPEALKIVPRDVLLREVGDAEGLLSMLTDRIDDELLANAPRLRAVSTMAAGYDNVDIAALNRRSVVLTNTPDVLTESTADLVWALMLGSARRIVEGAGVIAKDEWNAWSPLFLAGQDVHGATLGIVGAGRIGQAVARRAAGFGMRLMYYNRSRNHDFERDAGATYQALPDLLRVSDFVVCLAPLTDETRGMFGAWAFSQMKSTAVFVNAACGPVVNEADLLRALRAGRPWAAALDVFEREPIGADHPLVGMTNVLLTPHIGSATVRTRTAMAVMAAENLIQALRGESTPHEVNRAEIISS